MSWLVGSWLPHQSFTHIVAGGLVLRGGLDGVGQEAEDGADPQKDGEAAEELAAELDPLWGRWRRSQSVGAVAGQVLCRLGVGQTLWEAKEWRDERWEIKEGMRRNLTASERLTWTMSVLYFLQTSSTDILCSVCRRKNRWLTNKGSQSLHKMGSKVSFSVS